MPQFLMQRSITFQCSELLLDILLETPGYRCTDTMSIDRRILFVDTRRDGERQAKYVVLAGLLVGNDFTP